MLSAETYEYLRCILENRNIVHPGKSCRTFLDNFVPQHKCCHITAMQAAVEWGEIPVVGIQFLDLNGKLYPWPHVVNQCSRGLIDYSPIPDQPPLGFIETGWHEFSEWRAVTLAYNDRLDFADKPTWGDARADNLSNQFLEKLRAAVANLV